ncbi:MAG: S8 family serine peptidase [Terricaulis sp.]
MVRLEIGRDERGRERVVGEALLAGRDRDIARALDHGYQVISLQQAPSIDRTVARLRIPENKTIEAAVVELRGLAPGAIVTENTVYRSSQSSISISTAPAHPMRAAAPRGDLGIIDTGADVSALASPGALAGQRSFAGAYTPRDHGTIVAELASRMGMRVRVADVFGVANDGGLAASADALIAALDWMVANNVAVINISIEGPRNAILEQEIRVAARRGHVIVAAAGNGGPTAAPAFPAAYDGAVAVTAIDGTGHAYRRANRGNYVAFAAAGVDIPVALADHQVTVSGTSFSSPIVASQIAALMRTVSPAEARRALEALQHQAIDLGAPGRDPVFGWGAINPPQ